jgi:hypothetical protein
MLDGWETTGRNRPVGKKQATAETERINPHVRPSRAGGAGFLRVIGQWRSDAWLLMEGVSELVREGKAGIDRCGDKKAPRRGGRGAEENKYESDYFFFAAWSSATAA